jgi:hypothetical protein
MGRVVRPKRLDNDVYSIKEANMLRTKHKHISAIFTLLGLLCLWLCLLLAPRVTPAFAQPRGQFAPASRRPPYYVVDRLENPAAVYRIVNGKPSVLFRRRSGKISSIALRARRVFFCADNEGRIYERMGQRERIVFEQKTYIRDVAVDAKGYLYFTEAYGSKSDGRIYKLTPPIDKLGPKDRFRRSARPFYTVQLETVDGCWGGNCAFDSRGYLYLSTGNHRVPAFIYRVSMGKGTRYGSPRKIYKNAQGAIKGIAIEPLIQPNVPECFMYYSDSGKTIYRMDMRNSKRNVEFSKNITKSGDPSFSDIAFDIRDRYSPGRD